MLQVAQIWPGAPASCVLFIRPIILWVPSHFVAQRDVPCSSCTFSAPALESASSPKIPGFFYWNMVFRNQYLGTRCAHSRCSLRPLLSLFPVQTSSLPLSGYTTQVCADTLLTALGLQNPAGATSASLLYSHSVHPPCTLNEHLPCSALSNDI